MIDYEYVKDFWDYLEFYAEEDEDGYDGVHDGGIKGIKPDAPENAKKAYQEHLKELNKDVKI